MSDAQVEAVETVVEEKTSEKQAEKPAQKQPKVAAAPAAATREAPKTVVETVESGVAQAKQSYEQVQATAEEAAEALEETFAAAMRGASDLNEQILAAFKEEARAQFDLVRDLAQVESPAEVIELQGKFLRARLDAAQARSSAFAELVNRVAEDASEPVRESMLKTIRALTPAA